MKSTIKYPINIFGERWYFTIDELRALLTRHAYNVYFHVRANNGTVSFGLGAICSHDLLEQMMDGTIGKLQTI